MAKWLKLLEGIINEKYSIIEYLDFRKGIRVSGKEIILHPHQIKIQKKGVSLDSIEYDVCYEIINF